MREKFEQFIRDQSGLNVDFEIGCNGQYKSDLMYFMFTTWCYQQSKVDGLQQENKNLKSLLKGHELRHSQNLSIKKKLVARNDELQKRVDGAYIKLAMLRQTELWREDDIFELFDELEQVLKGGAE
ncbi:hypothetical protein [Acinetobacter dispersus]|uniref:hypothetical protein n=1 Tax=Acinetobacter dispersus TaxID=70348 RepID=UPI001F4A8F23|nr:hypothetical protein [Acinetobacter dispersus]MCH7392438.1 hypothetical protein [Acinetobacter dispersus]